MRSKTKPKTASNVQGGDMELGEINSGEGSKNQQVEIQVEDEINEASALISKSPEELPTDTGP